MSVLLNASSCVAQVLATGYSETQAMKVLAEVLGLFLQLFVQFRRKALQKFASVLAPKTKGGIQTRGTFNHLPTRLPRPHWPYRSLLRLQYRRKLFTVLILIVNLSAEPQLRAVEKISF